MRSLSRRILLGYALPIVLVILSAVIRARSVDTTLATLGWVAHTDEVLSDCHRLTRIVVDAESAQRGFLMGRDLEFIRPYRDASEAFHSAAADLRTLVADNPKQVQRLDEVSALFLKWRSDDGEPSVQAIVDGGPIG